MNLTARMPDLKLNADLDNMVSVLSQAILAHFTLLDTNSNTILDTNDNEIIMIGVASNTPSHAFTLTARIPDLRLSGDI